MKQFILFFSLLLPLCFAVAKPTVEPPKEKTVIETTIEKISQHKAVIVGTLAAVSLISFGTVKVGAFTLHTEQEMEAKVKAYFEKNPVSEIWTTNEGTMHISPSNANMRKQDLDRHFKQLKSDKVIDVKKWERAKLFSPIETASEENTPPVNDTGTGGKKEDIPTVGKKGKKGAETANLSTEPKTPDTNTGEQADT